MSPDYFGRESGPIADGKIVKIVKIVKMREETETVKASG